MSKDPYSHRSVGGSKLPSWLVVLAIVATLTFAWWQNNHVSQTKEPVATAESTTKTATGTSDLSQKLPDENEPSPVQLTPEHNERSEVAARTGHDHQSAEDRKSSPTKGQATAKSSVVTKSNRNSSTARATPSGSPSGLPNEVAQNTRSNPLKSAVSDRHRPTVQSDKPSYQVENQTIRDLYGKIVFKGTIDLKPTLDRIERGEPNRHRNDGTSFQNREGRLPRKTAGYYKEYVHPTPGENGPGPQRIIIGQEGEIWYTGDHYKTFKKIK